MYHVQHRYIYQEYRTIFEKKKKKSIWVEKFTWEKQKLKTITLYQLFNK